MTVTSLAALMKLASVSDELLLRDSATEKFAASESLSAGSTVYITASLTNSMPARSFMSAANFFFVFICEAKQRL